MKKYEIMFIVRPDLDEASAKQVAENMKNTIVNFGSNVTEVKEMGQRELAYEIKKYKNGYYFLFNVEANNADAIKEFDRLALISEDIIRHIVIKVED